MNLACSMYRFNLKRSLAVFFSYGTFGAPPTVHPGQIYKLQFSLSIYLIIYSLFDVKNNNKISLVRSFGHVSINRLAWHGRYFEMKLEPFATEWVFFERLTKTSL